LEIIFTKYLKLEIKQAFDLFDKDNSGTISFNEIKNVFNALDINCTDKDIQIFMKEMDSDGNIYIYKYITKNLTK
jgi:calcium-binding protein CML